MKTKKEYIIPFKGLKDGIHDFEFKIADLFFSELDYSEIKHGNLNVNVQLNKHTTFLELDIEIEGEVELTCDRCLDEYREDIDFQGVLYVKFGESSESDYDEIMILSEDEFELDLSHYLYESINLSLPLKRVHPEDEEGNYSCNMEMIAKLQELQNQHDGEKSIDPRWNGLKDLLSDN